jgi:multimeric flavodoxin WrbA
MAAVIMGISGSPIEESNTDRALREILERTGLEYEFIKLSRFSIEPCRACLGCTDDNSCRIYDNGRALAERFARMKGFVIGGYSTYGSLDSRTKTFMERMYCLRHIRSKNKGKLGIAVVTTDAAAAEAGLVEKQFSLWMEQEGIRNLGALVVPGNNSCIRCGHSKQCISLDRQKTMGPAESIRLEKAQLQPTVMTRAAELAIKLRDAVLASSAAVTEEART